MGEVLCAEELIHCTVNFHLEVEQFLGEVASKMKYRGLGGIMHIFISLVMIIYDCFVVFL